MTDKPVRVDTIVVSTQHAEEITLEQIQADIREHVIKPVVPAEWLDEETKYFINPTGRFVIGGPQGDAGLTGRKIIVDTYGGYARHGGGAFSGKDPTKVDRSAAYAARYVAKNIVAAGLADKCEIQLAYAIGVANPVSISVDTYGTGKVDEEKLVEVIQKNFDLRPAGIIKMLDLRRPIYGQTAAYGHFGRTDIVLGGSLLHRAHPAPSVVSDAHAACSRATIRSSPAINLAAPAWSSSTNDPTLASVRHQDAPVARFPALLAVGGRKVADQVSDPRLLLDRRGGRGGSSSGGASSAGVASNPARVITNPRGWRRAFDVALVAAMLRTA